MQVFEDHNELTHFVGHTIILRIGQESKKTSFRSELSKEQDFAVVQTRPLYFW